MPHRAEKLPEQTPQEFQERQAHHKRERLAYERENKTEDWETLQLRRINEKHWELKDKLRHGQITPEEYDTKDEQLADLERNLHKYYGMPLDLRGI